MLQNILFLEKLEVEAIHGRSVCNLIPKNRHFKWHYTENSLIHPSNHPKLRQTPQVQESKADLSMVFNIFNDILNKIEQNV